MNLLEVIISLIKVYKHNQISKKSKINSHFNSKSSTTFSEHKDPQDQKLAVSDVLLNPSISSSIFSDKNLNLKTKKILKSNPNLIVFTKKRNSQSLLSLRQFRLETYLYLTSKNSSFKENIKSLNNPKIPFKEKYKWSTLLKEKKYFSKSPIMLHFYRLQIGKMLLQSLF